GYPQCHLLSRSAGSRGSCQGFFFFRQCSTAHQSVHTPVRIVCSTHYLAGGAVARLWAPSPRWRKKKNPCHPRESGGRSGWRSTSLSESARVAPIFIFRRTGG